MFLVQNNGKIRLKLISFSFPDVDLYRCTPACRVKKLTFLI